MTLAPLDWAVLLGYGALIYTVGFWFSKRGQESVASYFVSGRSLPWWLAGASMAATSFAADTPLFITGIMRGGMGGARGVAANWYWWSFLFGHVLAIFVFAKLWRRAAVMTNIEITEVRFGGRPAAALRLLKSLYLALPINLAAVIWCTLGMQKVLEAVLGVSRFEATAACLALSVIYVLQSGLWGVVATDLLQFFVAFAGAAALAWCALGAAGGLGALEGNLDRVYGSGHGLLDMSPPLGGEAGWWSPATTGFFVYVGVLWWSSRNVDGGGALVQRMLACRDERHAVGATLTFTVLHYALRTWPWVLAALASMVLFPIATSTSTSTSTSTIAALAPFAERVAADPEYAYPAMIALLPVGLKGFLLASFFAAFASTVSSYLNLSASYLLNDLYRRFVRPDASDAHYLLVSKLIVVALTICATAIAYHATSIEAVFSFALAFSGGIGVVYVGRWIWWRVNAQAEIAAMLASGLTASAISLLPRISGTAFDRYEAARAALAFDPTPFRLLVTVIVTTLAALAATLFFRPEERKVLLEFYLRARPPGFWGPVREEAQRFLPRPHGATAGPTAIACVTAAVLILALTFGLGWACFGRWPLAAAALAVAVATGALALRAGRAAIVAALALAALPLAAGGCGEGSSRSALDPLVRSEGGSGALARDYLAPSPYSKMLVEVDFEDGAEPDQGSLDILKVRLEERCDKPGGVTVALGDRIPAQNRSVWSIDEIRALERRFRDAYHTQAPTSTAVLYYLYVRGGYEADTQSSRVLGVSHTGSSIAIFKDAVRGTVPPLTGPSVEDAVVVHEAGHNLGLVNNGIPMQAPHEDAGHRAHDVNDACVMFWAVETSLVSQLLGMIPDQFDAACIADAQAAGGK